MSFPAGLTLVTVTIQFDEWPLGGGDGTIRFESPSALIGPTDDSIVPPIDTVLPFPSTGHATIALPACNVPTWTPNNGWDYTVTVFIGAETIRGAVTLDYHTTTVNLADVFRLTLAPTPPSGSYVSTAQFNAAIADLQDEIDGIGTGAVSSVNGHTGVVVLTPTDLGLGNVNNTSDAAKPISTATQTALNLKAPLASPTFTGTVAGITKAMVGLGNVDNTSDATKPVSADTQTALNGKANTVHTHAIGDVTSLTATLAAKADLVDGVVPTAQIPAIATSDYLGEVGSQAAMLALDGQTRDWATRTDLGTIWVITGTDPTQLGDWTELSYPAAPVSSVNGQTGTVVLAKGDVGLGSVDNTADTAKPISTATQNALNLKAPIASPTFTGTVGGITAAMVGLGNVDNTSDTGKPVSTATQNALNLKAPLASPTFTGTVAGITAAMVGLPDIDDTGGLVSLGTKNGLAKIPFAGRRTSAGPPTTGTWASGDIVQAVDGFWQCTVGGTPGVWILLAASAGADRIFDAGEYVLDRDEIIGNTPATTGNLYMTHFRAARTETIMTLKTGTGGAGTVATSATHAWIGVWDWDGTDYTPNVLSVDDPTRWTAEFASYDTPVFDAATGLVQGFNKFAGREYAMGVLWVGSGQPPALPAGVGWYQDSLEPPRKNAFFITDTPPAVPVSGSFFGPDSRRFQAGMRR